jgi:pimeloyl-ACP methyl ester carboxylesterase
MLANHASRTAPAAFEVAEDRLFAACAMRIASRRVRLAAPPLAVRVLEAGDGPPLLLVHGSGMSASTWAPLLSELGGYRLIALDLPGFGLSDAFDYSGQSLREHAVTQLTSLLDALELERVPVIGTSLGGMWALCLAVDAPHRITALASLGVPAVALPGVRRDPYFTALSTPGLRQVVTWIGSPSVGVTRRALAGGAIGPRAAELAPDGFFDVVHEGMRQPGFRTAMLSHMWLAMRLGRPRPENFLSDAELEHIAVPALMVWGDKDPYGGPEIGERAAALIPNGHLEVIPARHAPFLDDPRRCGALINELLRAPSPGARARSDSATHGGTE